MLTAFKPRSIVELPQRSKFKIDCLLAYGDRLLVGLNNGSLRIYRTHDTPDSGAQVEGTEDGAKDQDAAEPALDKADGRIELLREVDGFSRKPIQQLAIFKEANVLISLSDGYVSLHDLQAFTLSDRLEKTKGSTLFSAISHVVKDESTGIPSILSRLAVAVKRKIYVWSWQDSELVSAEEETSLSATVKSLAWISGTKIVAGMDPGYVVVDMDTHDVSEITRPLASGEAGSATGSRFGAVSSSGMGYMGMGGWVPKPMSTKLSEHEMLLARDVNSLFIDQTGKAINRRQVPWSTAPDAIGYSYPYLLSLQPATKTTLDVRNPYSLALLQSITLPQAMFIHVPQPTISLAHAGKGFLVASERNIWQMDAIGYEPQIKELTSKELYDEAISLVDMLEDSLLYEKKQAWLRDIKIQKATALFQGRKYRDSLYLFAEAQAPPLSVISLYPSFIAGEYSKVGDKDTLPGEASPEKAEKKSAAVHKRAQSSGSKGKSGSKTWLKDSDTASITSSLNDTEDAVDDTPAKSDSTGTLSKDMRYAVAELNAFLAQTRVQLQRYLSFDGHLKDPKSLEGDDGKPTFANYIEYSDNDEDINKDEWEKRLLDTAVLVDTTLFRAYILTNPRLAGSLFRLDNFCAPAVVEKTLYELGRYEELLDFLGGKKLHHEALNLLQKFGRNEAETDVDESLRGPRRTVAYLKQLPEEMIDIILEYVQWPLDVDRRLGMEVFLADTENAESLPRQRIASFLENRDQSLAVIYLEHVIYELRDEDGENHERLLQIYLKEMHQGHKQPDDEVISEHWSASWRERMEKLLDRSDLYDANALLEQMPSDNPELYQSRAILYGSLGRHREALEIYVYKMQDASKAEQYCNKVYKSIGGEYSDIDTHKTSKHTEDATSVFNVLLSLYLEPPAPHEADLEAGLQLLSRHGSRISASRATELLPDPVHVQRLEDYFIGRMRSAGSLLREREMIRALSSLEDQKANADLLVGKDEEFGFNGAYDKPSHGRNRRVVVTEHKLCSVCHKRFGTAAIRVWPDGEMVHHGCSERRRMLGTRLYG